MFTEEAVFFFYTETPLHAGSGSSVAYVDLPIQREKHTEYPIVQASGVKGAFRSWAKGDYLQGDDDKKAELIKAFGPETKADEHSGALSFTDAQILLFPVRSFTGGFAWITCPLVLNRLRRMLKTAGIKFPTIKDTDAPINIPEPRECEQEAYTADPCSLIVDTQTAEKRVILEDFAFVAQTDHSRDIASLAYWIGKYAIPADPTFDYIREQLASCLVIISNEHFRDFTVLSTDVQTRISIGESGTVDQGPWNEELLLTDTLLYCLVLGKSMQYKGGDKYAAADAIAYAKGIVDKTDVLQLGGDETLGRGLVRVRHLDKRELKEEGERT